MLPDWILLLPLLFPLLGGVFFALIATRIPARTRAWLPILWLILQLTAILINIAPGSHRLAVLGWDAASFSIAFQIDGITLLLLMLMFVPLLTLWLAAPPRRLFDLFSILVLTGAIFLTIAANPLTIYIAWAVFDLTIFLWRIARDIERETAVRSVVIGQFTGLIFLAGAIVLSAGQSVQAATLIAVALWARMGLFPFHYLLPTRGTDSSDLWFARGVPLIAATNLWLHWSAFQIDLPFTLMGTLAVATLVVTAVWIWREETPARVVVVAFSQTLVFVPLAMTFGKEASDAIGLWLTLSALLGLALFEIALRWRAENLNRWSRLIWFAGLFAFAGFPLTPAFLGRIGIYVALWESYNGLVMLIAGLSSLAVLIPLWGFGFVVKGSESREPHRIEYAGLVIITLAFFALALLPMLIAHALAPNVGNSAERAIDLVVRTDDIPGVGLGILTLVIAVVVSFLAQPIMRNIHLRFGALIHNIAQVLDFEWAERFFVAVSYRLSGVARDVTSIAEENPTVWLLFAALWVAIFVMIAR